MRYRLLGGVPQELTRVIEPVGSQGPEVNVIGQDRAVQLPQGGHEQRRAGERRPVGKPSGRHAPRMARVTLPSSVTRAVWGGVVLAAMVASVTGSVLTMAFCHGVPLD
jgi:hypothetical protein